MVMLRQLHRNKILPETDLPSAPALIAQGGARAAHVRVGKSRFLSAHGVDCERAYKTHQATARRFMKHAQVGWRDPDVTAANMAEIVAVLGRSGAGVDRFGICLDWSMGYPADEREGRTKGTGLILRNAQEFRVIADATDAAAHFGDFVIGMPAALENTEAALLAGSTSIGNLGQFFTFRLPDWDDDVMITARTVEAISLCAAQPVDILIHSNLDDGFAARFSDLVCAMGAVLIERHIVETLLGARIGHCFGHTFSDLATRQAFHLALAASGGGPGSMIYGNTTAFGSNKAESYAALAAYLSADMAALTWAPSGHALTPIPVTEAERIPSAAEVADAQLFAHRLAERLEGTWADRPPQAVHVLSERIQAGGRAFFDNVMRGMADLGYDIDDPFEMLLALRRIGAGALESAFGPGAPDPVSYYGRAPLVASSVVGEISVAARRIVDGLGADVRAGLARRKPRICAATTDVHEYGKRLVEQVLRALDIEMIDGGISVDADDLARFATESGADVIAVSTYNGIARDYLERLRDELDRLGNTAEVFVGGRLNAVPDGSNTGLPVEIVTALENTGAVVCARVEDMLLGLASGQDN